MDINDTNYISVVQEKFSKGYNVGRGKSKVSKDTTVRWQTIPDGLGSGRGVCVIRSTPVSCRRVFAVLSRRRR